MAGYDSVEALTKDVSVKLLETLKHQTSEEAAHGLIYQALSFFKQNYDQIQGPQRPQLIAPPDFPCMQKDLEKHKYTNEVLKKGIRSF